MQFVNFKVLLLCIEQIVITVSKIIGLSIGGFFTSIFSTMSYTSIFWMLVGFYLFLNHGLLKIVVKGAGIPSVNHLSKCPDVI